MNPQDDVKSLRGTQAVIQRDLRFRTLALVGFLLYCTTALGVILYLIFSVAPKHGNSNIFVYLAICSLIGSLSVMSVKVRASLQASARRMLHCDSTFPARLPHEWAAKRLYDVPVSLKVRDCRDISWCAGTWDCPKVDFPGRKPVCFYRDLLLHPGAQCSNAPTMH